MPAGGNPSRREQHIETGATAEIQDDLSRMQLRECRRITAAEAGAEGESKVGDFRLRVLLFADGTADGIRSAATGRIAAAAAVAQLDGGLGILRSDGFPNRVHGHLSIRMD